MENRELESIRQELAGRLVQREVVCCVSSLMTGVMRLSQLVSYEEMQDALSTDSDELSKLFVRQDYEEAARAFIMDDADLDQLEEIAEQHGYWRDVLADAKVPEVWADDPDEDGDRFWGLKDSNAVHDAVYADEDDAREAAIESVLPAIRACVWGLVNTDDEFRWVCNEYNLDTDQLEVYEHWVISDWLQRKLAEKGEITGDVCGLTIWGRCTSGQSISLDGVIREITQELWPEEWSREKERTS